MRIIRKQAAQGHAIPSRVTEAMGPFARYTPIVEELDTEPEFLPGATSQNNMQGAVIYECRYCNGLVREDALDNHLCAGPPQV